ncbi:MAG: head morphogenesis protein [Devosiaceae bacterium]|nr:head morphogenesis protein [Devosiaceae bacterium MH13]
MRDTHVRFNALLNRLRPKLRTAFLAAVQDIANSTDLAQLVTALERGDVDGALRVLQIGPEFYRPLENALVEVYGSGGNYAVESLPKRNPETGQRLVIRFGLQNPRAQRWLSEESSRLITEIVQSQRAAARETLRAGLARGRAPRATALDLVGRVSKTTRRRTGGTIGLTERDAQTVLRYRSQLEAEGRPADQVDRMVTKRENRLLRQRGERIARTETMAALNAGRMEAMRQAVDDGKLRADAITKRWRATKDSRVRDAHVLLDGQSVGFDEPFRSITGALLQHPGDTSMGASGRDIINCRCTFRFVVNYAAGLE